MYKAKVFLLEWTKSSTIGSTRELTLQVVQKDILFYDKPTKEDVADVIRLFNPSYAMGRYVAGALRALPGNTSLNFTVFEVADDDV